MTLAEFKAWFEGFTDGMDGPPNEAQWKRIQERLATVTAPASIAEIGRTVFPAPAVDPCRQILGQNLTGAQAGPPAGWEKVTLSAAGPSSNSVGAVAFSVRTPPMDDSDCRPLDLAAALWALAQNESSVA